MRNFFRTWCSFVDEHNSRAKRVNSAYFGSAFAFLRPVLAFVEGFFICFIAAWVTMHHANIRASIWFGLYWCGCRLTDMTKQHLICKRHVTRMHLQKEENR